MRRKEFAKPPEIIRFYQNRAKILVNTNSRGLHLKLTEQMQADRMLAH